MRPRRSPSTRVRTICRPSRGDCVSENPTGKPLAVVGDNDLEFVLEPPGRNLDDT